LKAKISSSLALVLVHDLLCSKGGIAAASGQIKDAILRHKTRLKADFVRAQLLRGDKFDSEDTFSHG
jgi:25S rRNA (cytosine2278-C5)-methyltransferase